MYRKFIMVGDATGSGGTVLPFTCHPLDSINGHQKAFIGSRVFCTACNSVGWIAKAGGPFRPRLCDAELALEGDVVDCQCAVSAPLVSSKQSLCFCPISPGKDSKISTLIHEVTHYVDILDTHDHFYGFGLSKKSSGSNVAMVKANADNYSSYICNEMMFPD